MSSRDDGSSEGPGSSEGTWSAASGSSNPSSSSDSQRTSTLSHVGSSEATRWLLLLSPLVVPWVVVRTAETTILFPWGMLWLEGADVVSLPTYLDGMGGLPRHLRMWPLGVLCYALALAWAGGRRFGTDQRVAAGLFVLVALSTAWLSSGLAVGPNRTALPLGSIHALVLAVWVYVTET